MFRISRIYYGPQKPRKNPEKPIPLSRPNLHLDSLSNSFPSRTCLVHCLCRRFESLVASVGNRAALSPHANSNGFTFGRGLHTLGPQSSSIILTHQPSLSLRRFFLFSSNPFTSPRKCVTISPCSSRRHLISVVRLYIRLAHPIPALPIDIRYCRILGLRDGPGIQEGLCSALAAG